MRIVIIVYFICALEYRYAVLSRGMQHQRGLTIPKVLIAVPREFSLRERERELVAKIRMTGLTGVWDRFDRSRQKNTPTASFQKRPI